MQGALSEGETMGHVCRGPLKRDLLFLRMSLRLPSVQTCLDLGLKQGVSGAHCLFLISMTLTTKPEGLPSLLDFTSPESIL